MDLQSYSLSRYCDWKKFGIGLDPTLRFGKNPNFLGFFEGFPKENYSIRDKYKKTWRTYLHPQDLTTIWGYVLRTTDWSSSKKSIVRLSILRATQQGSGNSRPSFLLTMLITVAWLEGFSPYKHSNCDNLPIIIIFLPVTTEMNKLPCNSLPYMTLEI